MNQPHPTEILMSKHRVIKGVLRALEAELQTLEKPPSASSIAPSISSPTLETHVMTPKTKSSSSRLSIGVMLYEHTQCRACLAKYS
jgi:hypothetical protein